MNIDDIRKLFETDVNAADNDLAQIGALEVTNPIVQASEAIRKLVAALHQAPGSPPASEAAANVDRLVAPFSDYLDKLLNYLADEQIEQSNAGLTEADLAENVSASESIIDKNRLEGIQDQADQLKAIEPSAITGLQLAICTANALPHSSALYTSSIKRNPQQMAAQCQQECREANNLDKTIRQTLDGDELLNISDQMADLIEEIYDDPKSPGAKQQAEQLLELTERFKTTAGTVFQWAACARLNVLNARQFVEDLKEMIEPEDLDELASIVEEASDAFFNRLLDDIAPELYRMLLTNCVARKLVEKTS